MGFCHKVGLAAGTRRAYSKAVGEYVLFCKEHGFVNQAGNAPWPNEEVMMYFAGWLKYTKGNKPDTVGGKLSGFSSEVVGMGMPHPMDDERGVPPPQLKRMLRGMKRRFSGKRKRRDALTVDKLCGLCNHIRTRGDLTEMDKATYIALLCAGVYMMMRIGEMVCKSQKKFNPEKNPSLADVSFNTAVERKASEAGFDVKASKTDHYRQGITLRVAANGSSTCAVAALAEMVALRKEHGAKPHEPAFVLEGGKYVTRQMVQDVMQEGLTAIGMVASNYTTHSLRIGGATSLAACEEMDADRIRVLGRWSSDCFLRYLRETTAMRRATSRMLGAMSTADWQSLETFNPAGG